MFVPFFLLLWDILLALTSLKQIFDKAKCIKIICGWWRLMKTHLKIMFLLYWI